jgi:hypothetical protein
MPITTRYIEETGIFETSIFGHVDDAEYLSHYQQVISSGVVPPDSLELTIIERSADIGVSSDTFLTIIRLLENHVGTNAISRTAIVTHTLDQELMVKHFARLSASIVSEKHQMKTFDSPSAAVVWLLGHQGSNDHQNLSD